MNHLFTYKKDGKHFDGLDLEKDHEMVIYKVHQFYSFSFSYIYISGYCKLKIS